jgi:hypothetical protein
VSEDLIDWLRAQLDTCEAKNLRVLEGDNWDWFAGSESGSERALQEVGIFRKLLDLHEPREYVTYLKHVTYWQCGYCAGLCHSRSGLGCEQPVDALWPCDTVRLLAAIFSDRPGFQEAWRR